MKTTCLSLIALLLLFSSSQTGDNIDLVDGDPMEPQSVISVPAEEVVEITWDVDSNTFVIEGAESVQSYLTITPSFATVDKLGGTLLVTLTAPEAWTSSSAGWWCTSRPNFGPAGTQVINIDWTTNETGSSRWADITFVSGTKTIKFGLTQFN